jgi:hypothetical protein
MAGSFIGTVCRLAFDDANKLPHCLALLHSAELFDFYILSNSSMHIMSNKIDNHEVFGNLFPAAP